uniref:Growth arrest specific 1 n=1 Tax=Bos mutus grunniens TaxID=30521 RepID=A0A8B9WQ51_BOSMU
MHNEGAPRHHAGAPGPLLYLKPRSERVCSRAQRIRSPGSLSPEKPPPREAREPLLSRRAEFPVFPVPPGKSSPEPRPGSPRAEGEGTRAAGPREGGQRPDASQEAARCENPRRRRGTESGRKEPPRPHNGSAGAKQNAPAAPRGPAAPPRPRGQQPPRAAVNASRHCRGPTGGALHGRALLGRPRSPSESRPSASSGATAGVAHGFMKTLMQEVGRTGANFSAGSASAAPRASSPFRSSPGGGARRGTVPGAWLCLMALLQLLGSAPRGSGLAHGRRLICWQALLQCQGEPECSYAYNQYAEACAPVLAQRGGSDVPGAAAAAAAFPASAASFSSRWRCPSHCISALIQLNHTRRGPALEDCDCAQDENCKSTKRAIEPCLPRTSGGGAGGPGAGAGGVLGCTEARRRCDRDSRCNLALSRYLTYCGKLFNGLRCTDECRTVIEDMLAMPKAALLNDCVCDGLERPICESVKENMARLCFGAELGNGPGSSGSDGGLDDYYDEEYDDEQRTGGTGGEQPLDDDDGVPHPPRPGGGAAAAGGRGDLPYGPGRRSSGAGCRSAPRSAWTLFASILLLPLLF